MFPPLKQNPSGSLATHMQECTCQPIGGIGGKELPIWCDWCIKDGWRFKDASKEQLVDMIIEISNRLTEKNKDVKEYYFEIKNPEMLTREHSMYWLEGDCIAQCLNCIRAGHENGYACKCGKPQWTMDSDAIRKAGGKV